MKKNCGYQKKWGNLQLGRIIIKYNSNNYGKQISIRF